MQETNTSQAAILQFRQDIEVEFRQKIREALDVALREELAVALGSNRHERTDRRCGYRNGGSERTITTPEGPRTVTVPRGRIVSAEGPTHEFHSQLLPRYARRTREIDDAILGCYLGGINSRRIRTALKPLLGERHLSKSAVSRIVGRLKALFTSWQDRDLSTERYPIVFLDGFHLKVRVARRVVSVPVLAALGAAENGQKVLIDLRVAASEAAATWGDVITSLQRRGLTAPLLIVVDGHVGLKRALERWEGVRVQRCSTHKLANLKSHCPTHAQAEMKRDYHRILYAADGLAARAAYDAFVKKWTTLCPAVAKSLEEAGLELLTFYDFPKPMWKSLRTTNTLENLNREFRRRTKTQASFSTEDAALIILYGLVAFGQIQLRKIDGHQQLPSFIAKEWQKVA
ncbi:MAG TPA: IS256 family transposase [Vicinamibacterales bacterium]|nr:IS256 family transposase [Vicinamibacterales bacterium]